MANPSFPLDMMLDTLLGEVNNLTELDKRIVAFHGTIAEWNREAAEFATSYAIEKLVTQHFDSVEKWEDEAFGSLKNSTTVGEFVEAAETIASNSKQFALDLAQGWIKQTHGDNNNVDGLLSEREELVVTINSYVKVLLDQSKTVKDETKRNEFIAKVNAITIPDAPQPDKKGKASGKRDSSEAYIQFYRIDADGSRFVRAESQQKASSIAFYDFKASTEDMETALKAAGWDGSYTKPFGPVEITVPDKKGIRKTTRTIGWDIIQPESSDSDNKEDDNKEDEIPDGDSDNKESS